MGEKEKEVGEEGGIATKNYFHVPDKRIKSESPNKIYKELKRKEP